MNGLIERHVAGSLPMPLDVLARAHLEINPRNRAYVRDLEGLMADNAMEVADGALSDPEAMLADVFNADVSDLSVARQGARREAWMPDAISELMGPQEVSWRGKMPGFKEMHLGTVDGCEMSLFWIKAGRAIPMHTHEGSEMTLVLEGGFSDGQGHYVRGDISIADHNVDHRPVADDDGPCIGFAVTTDALRLTGPIRARILDILGRG
ncbi:MAG: ChrR family anti-sigma-E factor [Pseudomonadota bacterium]